MRGFRATVLGLAALGCGAALRPLPPPDGPGTCETAQETLTRLGGCGVDLGTFLADCEETTKAEAEIGLRFPVGCLTASKSCAEANECR